MNISAEFKKSFDLIRASAPTTFEKGRAIKGATTTTSEIGSVQAAREEELLQLPEGQRNKGAIVIYTEPELPYHRDGDPAGVTPFKAWIEPQGLRLLVPTTAPNGLFKNAGVALKKALQS